MSGIAGIYNPDGAPVDGGLLSRMSAALAHRGPDGAANWIDGKIGFAHLMLRTTPESLHETQPLLDATGKLCMVMDGRIDDRESLRSALIAQGVQLRDDTDAELVLGAYRIWREDCPKHMVGDFALAIWDQARQQLFCARDLAGIKPFYYFFDSHIFAFASELRSLLSHPAVPSALNETNIGEALLWRFTSSDQTIYRDVRKLPPASALVVDVNGVRVFRYWTGEDISELRYQSDADYIEHFLQIYPNVVASHLRSQCAVGVRLSGGVDSSSVAAMGRRYVEQNSGHPGFAAYSVVVPGDPDDEGEFINLTSAHLQLRSHQFPPFQPNPEFYTEQVAFYRDWPEYPNGLTVDGLRASAKQEGIRVMLTGFGGGDWFTGSPEYFVELFSQGRLLKMLSDARRFSGPGHPATRLIRHAVASNLPLLKNTFRRIFPPTKDESELPPWISPQLLKRLSPESSPVKLWSKAQRDTCQQAIGALSVHLGEMEERADSRFGIEGRHPLNDRRVIEFALSLPEHQRRLVPGKAKHLLRMSMQGFVPDEIRLRGISAYGSSSVAKVLFTEYAASIFEDLKTAELGWVNAARVRDSYLANKAAFAIGDARYRDGLTQLWMLYAAETCLRMNLGC